MIKKTILGSLFMTCALTAGAQGIYQFADPGFEQEFEVSGEPGRGWHSFATAGGGLASFASMSPAPVRATEGYQSAHSVKLTSKFAGIPGFMGANANGNLTTGRINMGNKTPSDKTNFNHTDLTGDSKKNLEPQYLEFAGTPDAVKFYAKFTAGSGNKNKQGRGQFILHDEFAYQDPEVDDQVSHRVGKASQLIEESTDWKQYTVPFTYDQDVKPAKQYLLASFTTNPEPGESVGDVLYIDEIHFVYNSELASLTYDGKPVSEIANTINLSDQVYDATKLSYTLTGKGATVDKSYDEATGVLTLTVKGNDWTEEDPSNQHEYKIQFATPKPDEADGDYTPLLKISVAGSETFVPSVNDINIQYSEENGTVFTMKDFNFAGMMDLGDVVVPGATLSYVNGGIKVSVKDKKVTLPVVGEVGITVNAIVDDNKELTGTVDITYPLFPISVSLEKCPFERELTNYTLTVKGEVTSDVAAAVVPLGEKVGLVDLTQATLGARLNTSNFLYDPEATNNVLYKISDTQSLEGNNIIENGVCDNFVLTDGQSFNAPEGFTANQITYKRATAASMDEKDEVYTFVLPFTFTADKVNGTVYELAGVNEGVLDFTNLEGSMELKANRPYLVVSNGTQLLNASAFSGEVVATGDLTNEVYGGVTMVGAYEVTPITSGASESWYGYNAKGEFVKATSGTINPFRTAIKSTGSQSSFALKLDGTVTGIVNLENPNAKVDVYTISGVCVRKNVPAASALNGLSRGVYIVGGQKVVK